MPYISPPQRQLIDEGLGIHVPPLTLGELNYVITRLLQDQEPKRYDDYNALIGVLECCKLEFYRRAVAAYEDKKIKENGDVYNG